MTRDPRTLGELFGDRPDPAACAHEAHRPPEPSVRGEARHAAERDKRKRLREELAAMLDEPLIDARLLTAAERQQIRLAETLRRRPVRRPK
jgi:hypothetical protein